MKRGGYYTVEAVFTVSICVWVLVALCYGGLYVHDRLTIESSVNRVTADWLAEPGKTTQKQWEKQAEEKTDRQLFLMKVQKVEMQKMPLSRKVRVSYSLSVSFPFLKKLWMDGKETALYETVREKVCPAEYRWDAELLKK